MAKRQYFKSSEQLVVRRESQREKDKIKRKARLRKLHAYAVKTGQIVDQTASMRLALDMMVKPLSEKPKLLTEYEKSQQSLDEKIDNLTEVARYSNLLSDSKDSK